jgi:D-tyrosyl-tRNA(Tyr) deacylase
MRAVVQRALDASVTVDERITGSFTGPGLVVLVGVTHGDTDKQAERLAEKIFHLRIFERHHAPNGSNAGDDPSSELSASDLGLPVIVVSQFTLYADTRKGRRPTWDAAAPREVAEPRVERVVQALRDLGATVETGVFGADMRVAFTNDGPITIILDV